MLTKLLGHPNMVIFAIYGTLDDQPQDGTNNHSEGPHRIFIENVFSVVGISS